ncbi:unnamed protein product [Rotaria sordida]|uniref:Uncharacterized protein n=1 Tax=Rotaria sordida TaxID=392033 RepID=A0A820DQW8_9BILA|nr:unnamed protein product [Rotaria sordida]
MDIDSPSSQGLCDHDERFRVPTPPPPLPPPLTLPPLPSTNETNYTQPLTSLIFTATLSNEPNKIFDNSNYSDSSHKSIEQYQQNEILLTNSHLIPKSESIIIPSEETVFKTCLGQYESLSSSSSSSENSPIDNNNSSSINDNTEQEDSNRSRDEFVNRISFC